MERIAAIYVLRVHGRSSDSQCILCKAMKFRSTKRTTKRTEVAQGKQAKPTLTFRMRRGIQAPCFLTLATFCRRAGSYGRRLRLEWTGPCPETPVDPMIGLTRPTSMSAESIVNAEDADSCNERSVFP